MGLRINFLEAWTLHEALPYSFMSESHCLGVSFEQKLVPNGRQQNFLILFLFYSRSRLLYCYCDSRQTSHELAERFLFFQWKLSGQNGFFRGISTWLSAFLLTTRKGNVTVQYYWYCPSREKSLLKSDLFSRIEKFPIYSVLRVIECNGFESTKRGGFESLWRGSTAQ